MALAGMGAIADALSDVALGYTEGLLKPTREQLERERQQKFEKAQEDIATARTVQKLNEAHALYYGRPTRAGRLYKVGNNLVQDNEEGKPEVVYEGPAKEPNELERLRAAARAHMERIIGKKYGLTTVPIEAWKDEDWDDPALDKLRDFAGVGRSPLATYPGGGGDVGPKRDVPGYGGRPREQKAPPAKTDGEVPAPSEKPAPAPAPAPPKVAVTPSTTQPPTGGGQQPAAPEQKSAGPGKTPAPRAGTALANEQAVQIRIPAFEAMKDEDLVPALQGLRKRQQQSPSPSTLADIEAAERVLAKRRDQGITGESPTQFPDVKPEDIAEHVKYWTGQPDAKLTAHYALVKKRYDTQPSEYDRLQLAAMDQVRKGKQPPATGATPPATGEAAVPTSPTAEAATPTRKRNMPLTKEQQAEENRKAEDQEMQRQALANSQEQTRISQANQQLAQRRLDEELKERDRANQRKDRAAAYKAEQNIVQETKDLRGQIDGSDETIALIRELRRYVTPETVGVRGAVTQVWQQIKGQFETPGSSRVRLTGEAAEMQKRVNSFANKHQKDAQTWQDEENSLAREQGRVPTTIYIPNYSKFDPRMTFIDYLREVVAYSQARAMNGVGRLTDQDLVHAKKALMIDDWKIPAQQMQAALGYVEKELKAKKARDQVRIAAIEKRLRQHAAGAAGAETSETPKEE